MGAKKVRLEGALSSFFLGWRRVYEWKGSCEQTRHRHESRRLRPQPSPPPAAEESQRRRDRQLDQDFCEPLRGTGKKRFFAVAKRRLRARLRASVRTRRRSRSRFHRG